MRILANGTVPLVDVLSEAGYGSSSGKLAREFAVEAGVTPTRAVISATTNGGSRGGAGIGYVIPAKDAPGLVELLRERRLKTTSPEERLARMAHARTVHARKRTATLTPAAAKPAPPPVLPEPGPVATPIGFKAERSLEEELTGLTRRLKQILPKLGIGEYVISSDVKAEHGYKAEATRTKVTVEEIK